jgi:hypothetical protein
VDATPNGEGPNRHPRAKPAPAKHGSPRRTTRSTSSENQRNSRPHKRTQLRSHEIRPSRHRSPLSRTPRRGSPPSPTHVILLPLPSLQDRRLSPFRRIAVIAGPNPGDTITRSDQQLPKLMPKIPSARHRPGVHHHQVKLRPLPHLIRRSPQLRGHDRRRVGTGLVGVRRRCGRLHRGRRRGAGRGRGRARHRGWRSTGRHLGSGPLNLRFLVRAHQPADEPHQQHDAKYRPGDGQRASAQVDASGVGFGWVNHHENGKPVTTHSDALRLTRSGCVASNRATISEIRLFTLVREVGRTFQSLGTRST